MLDSSVESVIQSELSSDEKIHWVGKPDPSVIFNSSDLLAIPFSLMWGGFAIFWEWSALSIHDKVHGDGPGVAIGYIFPLWGIPFVCIGLYMIFGRFFYKAWKKSKTTYAVTNKRVLVVTQGFSQQVQAQFLDQIPVINKTISSNGVGCLTFGNLGFSGMYANAGFGFLAGRYNQGVLGFYDIHEAEGVHQIINKLRSEK
jgi:hypothetical protein